MENDEIMEILTFNFRLDSNLEKISSVVCAQVHQNHNVD